MLAKALGAKTNKVIIATKVGWVKGTAENAYEALHVRHQCEQSLANLKREYIDIYYFHHGDFGPNDRYVDEAVATVRKMRDEGKIRFIGLSTYSETDFQRLVPKIKPDVLQGSCSAMNTGYIKPGTKTAELMKKEDIKMVGFSPFVHGLLLGKYTADKPLNMGRRILGLTTTISSPSH